MLIDTIGGKTQRHVESWLLVGTDVPPKEDTGHGHAHIVCASTFGDDIHQAIRIPVNGNRMGKVAGNADGLPTEAVMAKLVADSHWRLKWRFGHTSVGRAHTEPDCPVAAFPWFVDQPGNPALVLVVQVFGEPCVIRPRPASQTSLHNDRVRVDKS